MIRKTLALLKTRFEASGGAEKYAHVLAEAFQKKGYDVTVLTTGPLTRSYPFTVHTYRFKSHFSVNKLWEFEGFCEKFLRTHPFEIVLGLDRNRFQTHLRASSGVHKAYLEHRKHFDPLLKRFSHLLNPLHSSLLHIEKVGFEHPDLRVLFTNSHLVKEDILNHYIVDPNKIHVIHNGVDWQQCKTPFEETPYHCSRFEYLFVGSGFARKGLRLILEALPHLGPDVHLTVVGGDKHLAKYSNCYRDRVTFVGPQNSIISYLQKADCLVIPSYYDPFANVTVEALAMGLTVISSKTNGGCEILKPETGIIIENLHSKESVITSLKKAMTRPKIPTRAKMIRDSVEHLDFSKQLDQYLNRC